jgi:signal transduction histidine kinase
LSQLLLSKIGNIEQYDELLDTFSRNAKRLNRLTEDLLDVTKIESQSLQLHTERFNLDHVILNVLDDIVLTTQFNGTNVQILYQPQDTFTGLGLFISRRIVEAHGGKIWSENNSHEKGATFTFSLPLSKEKPSQATKICELIQCC